MLHDQQAVFVTHVINDPLHFIAVLTNKALAPSHEASAIVLSVPVDFEFSVKVSDLIAATVFAKGNHAPLVIFGVVADFMAYATHICIERVRVLEVIVFPFHASSLSLLNTMIRYWFTQSTTLVNFLKIIVATTSNNPEDNVMETEAFSRVVKIVGSKVKIAQQCGVSPQVVQKWKSVVPAKHVVKLEKLTGGEVRREELRPDVFYD